MKHDKFSLQQLHFDWEYMELKYEQEIFRNASETIGKLDILSLIRNNCILSGKTNGNETLSQQSETYQKYVNFTVRGSKRLREREEK